MKSELKNPNVVVLGGWNRHIFNTDWVQRYIFPDDDNVTSDHAVSQGLEASPQFSNGKLKIFVIADKLVVESTDQDLNALNDTLIKIAGYLPHTPVYAFGVNIKYKFKEYRDELFSFKYDSILSEDGAFEISKPVVKRTLKGPNINQLNLAAIGLSDGVQIEFNFHESIKNIVDFKEKLEENSIVDRYEQSVNILKLLEYEQ